MKSQKKIDPAIIAAEEHLLIDYQFLVQELMVAKNFSRTALADLTGLSKARISQILSPEANPTVKTMARLIHALGEQAVVSTKSATKTADTTERERAPRVARAGWGDFASNDNISVMFWKSDSALEAA